MDKWTDARQFLAALRARVTARTAAPSVIDGVRRSRCHEVSQRAERGPARHGRTHVSRRLRPALVAALVVGLLLTGLVATANAVVITRTDDQVTDDPEELRPAQVAIVPGSLVREDGTLGTVVRERLDAAVALYRLGVVDKLLLSGDNGTTSYNEPDAMRDAALAAGVPPEDVFTDYAGFNTWHSMRRARDVFEVTDAVVVTQAFHVARAVDLGEAAGLQAQGFIAGTRGAGSREVLARVRGLVEATFRPSVTDGPVIPITGDGRNSWAERPTNAGHGR